MRRPLRCAAWLVVAALGACGGTPIGPREGRDVTAPTDASEWARRIRALPNLLALADAQVAAQGSGERDEVMTLLRADHEARGERFVWTTVFRVRPGPCSTGEHTISARTTYEVVRPGADGANATISEGELHDVEAHGASWTAAQLAAFEAVFHGGVVAATPAPAPAPADAAPAPSLSMEEFGRRALALAAFSTTQIGPIGGGPIAPNEAVMTARALVAEATLEQLAMLLAASNAAVRAHAAREIIHGRPEALGLLGRVSRDKTKVGVGSMRDTPPIKHETITIAEMVQRELAYTGQELP